MEEHHSSVNILAMQQRNCDIPGATPGFVNWYPAGSVVGPPPPSPVRFVQLCRVLGTFFITLCGCPGHESDSYRDRRNHRCHVQPSLIFRGSLQSAVSISFGSAGDESVGFGDGDFVCCIPFRLESILFHEGYFFGYIPLPFNLVSFNSSAFVFHSLGLFL
jgi:hypothetical protein